MDVNLRQVRAFLTVSRLGSFTRAARELNLSQPALTVQIRQLEQSLGIRLLDRNTRQVAPTRLGRELAPAFERLLAGFGAVVAEARDAAAHRGTVRIAALPSFAAGLLPEIVARFREANPGVTFAIRDVIAGGVTAAVRSEEVDLGVTGGAVQDPELAILHEWIDQMVAIFPDGLSPGLSDGVELRHLAEFPLVLMHPATSVRAVVDEAFRAAGLEPRASAEATYMSTAIGMVRAGLGVAILPASAMELRAEPSLRVVPIVRPALARTLSLVKKRGRTLPPISALFAETLAGA